MNAIELRFLRRRLRAAERVSKIGRGRIRELLALADHLARNRVAIMQSDIGFYFGVNARGPACENAIGSAIFWRDQDAAGKLR